MFADIVIERTYPHPVDVVWHALTDPEAIAAWYAINDFKAEVGHQFTFEHESGPGFDGFLYGEVLRVEPPHRLSYRITGGLMRRDSIVTFTLTAEGDTQTHLLLEHTDWKGLPDIFVSFVLKNGWGTFLRNLPGVVNAIANGEPLPPLPSH